MKKLNLDKEILYKRYIVEKKSTIQIGREVGCTPETINRYLREYGIPIRSFREQREGAIFYIDKETLYRKYIIEKKNPAQIGKEIGCPRRTIHRHFKKYGIPSRSFRGANGKFSIDRETLYRKYITENKTPSRIAKEVGCSISTIQNYLKKHDTPIKPYSETHRAFHIEARTLYILYWVEKMSQSEIGKMFGCHSVTISKCMKESGIRIRSVGECSKGELSPWYKKFGDDHPASHAARIRKYHQSLGKVGGEKSSNANASGGALLNRTAHSLLLHL